MSKLSSVQNWPDESGDFRYALLEKLREIIELINSLTDLNLNVMTTIDAMPTDPGYADEIRLLRGKTVQGTTPNQHILTGYQYVGGVWHEMQIRTGT